MATPTKEEIEDKLMEIFNLVSVSREVKKGTTYILNIIKKVKNDNDKKTKTLRDPGNKE